MTYVGDPVFLNHHLLACLCLMRRRCDVDDGGGDGGENTEAESKGKQKKTVRRELGKDSEMLVREEGRKILRLFYVAYHSIPTHTANSPSAEWKGTGTADQRVFRSVRDELLRKGCVRETRVKKVLAPLWESNFRLPPSLPGE